MESAINLNQLKPFLFVESMGDTSTVVPVVPGCPGFLVLDTLIRRARTLREAGSGGWKAGAER